MKPFEFDYFGEYFAIVFTKTCPFDCLLKAHAQNSKNVWYYEKYGYTFMLRLGKHRC